MEKFFHETFLMFISLTVNAFVGASKMLKEQKDAHLSRAMTMYGDYLLRVCFTYVQDWTVAEDLVQDTFVNFFQRVFKHPLKEVKASGGCHGIGKEFFVQAQSRFRTQLC
ncbi:sigma factor [Lysinibacillus sp. JNUCC 51]|uniref:sigma factor n=1 Tax=Lysinibacillus sp. JNUCC-51 TaxID=2792479 RepID=UPI0019389B95|nr:hypothetical protein JNUCC51_01435 [Lysinibacillus sp. JNUCC-51]